jgi:hypothetical protein
MNNVESAFKHAMLAVYAMLRCLEEHYYPWGVPELDNFQSVLIKNGLLDDGKGPIDDSKNG